jgi:hypothetical protein
MINSGERGFGRQKFSHAERERRWSRVREFMCRDQSTQLSVFPIKATRINFKPTLVI